MLRDGLLLGLGSFFIGRLQRLAEELVPFGTEFLIPSYSYRHRLVEFCEFHAVCQMMVLAGREASGRI